MNNSEGHNDVSEVFQKFVEKSITQIAPQLFKTVGSLNRFFLEPFYYNMIRIWNNLLCDSQDVRDKITHKMRHRDHYSSINEASDAQIMMQILYKTYLDLYQFVSQKTFYDRNYKELWDVYFNVGDVIKNVCEKNNETCKLFFNRFGLAINSDTTNAEEGAEANDIDQSYNLMDLKRNIIESEIPETPMGTRRPQTLGNWKEHRDSGKFSAQGMAQVTEESAYSRGSEPEGIVFGTDIVVHLKNELFKNLAYIGLNTRKSETSRTDHPELYFTIGRQFDILCELINGPCKANQKLLLEINEDTPDRSCQFNPKDVEIILNICRRNVVDLNSGFIDLQSKAYTFLLALFEGGHKEAIDLIAARLDPNHIFRILIDYTKRLYVQTKFGSRKKTSDLNRRLKTQGLLSPPSTSMFHYKKRKFDPEAPEDPSTLLNSQTTLTVPTKKKNLTLNGKNLMSTLGDLEDGDLGSDKSSYNFWMAAPKKLRKYLENVYEIKSTKELNSHYLLSDEFCNHQALELIIKIYAVLRTMERNFKFKGFVMKKTVGMKKHYYMLKNVAALCSSEEIEMYRAAEIEAAQEDITIWCFLTDVVRSVEILNNAGENTWAYYKKHPKVFY